MTWLPTSGTRKITITRKVVSLTGNGAVSAGTAGRVQKCYVYSIQSRNDGMSVQFTDGNGGVNLTHVWTLNAREGAAPPALIPGFPIFQTSLGNGIFAVVTGAGTVDIDASFWDDDAA